MAIASPARRACAIAVAAAAIAASFASAAAGGPRRDSNQHATVSSLRLSPADLYETLALVDGRLILSGGPEGESAFPSASFTAGPRFPPAKGCHSSVLDPATLTLSGERTGDCIDPRLYGVDVLPLNSVDNGTPRGSTVRIVHATATGYAVGPVVMRYSEYSDTNAEWVFGDGYLWLYDPTTTRGAVVLRISQSTGAVLQTIHMPWVDRPLLAADSDGFWIAAAVNSGFDPSSAGGLYRLAPGMARPVLVRKIRSDAYWMLAAGHSLWLDVNHDGKSSTLLRFDGTSTNPALDIRAQFSAGFDVETGYQQIGYAGDSTAGIWTVVPQGPGQTQQRVVRIDPASGRPSQVASITPPGSFDMEYASVPVAVLGGSVFFLDPPSVSYPGGTSAATVQGSSALYRVTPR